MANEPTKGFGGEIDPISAGIKAGTEIVKTIASISDLNKRRKFEQSLALLTNAQQRELNNKLAAIKDKNEKVRILSESLTKYVTDNALAGARKDTILFIVAGTIITGLLILTVVFAINRNKQ